MDQQVEIVDDAKFRDKGEALEADCKKFCRDLEVFMQGLRGLREEVKEKRGG